MYVVSSTLAETVWRNGTVITGDVAEEVKRLKDRIDGEIVVYASRPLVHALFENDLVDEIRLFVFPVIAGTGERIFSHRIHPARIRTTSTRAQYLALAPRPFEIGTVSVQDGKETV